MNAVKVASGEARYEISETRLSLITVCFNSLGGLATSHESLSAQGKGPWEWVVVDGGSKDGSLAWLQAQRPAVLVSEPDAGIYDAMNKGARLARGEYVYFLNAGDRFADARVLADVVERLRAQPELGLLYGNAVYVDPDGRRQTQRYQHLTPANLLFGNLCHQAVFARRALFEQLGGFDLQYPVAADLDWLARVFRSGVPRACLDRDICLFATGGMHMRRLDQLQTDKRRMQAALMGRSARAWGQFRYRLERRIRRWRGE